MEESGGTVEPAEMNERLARLEDELARQRAEMSLLRAELLQMRERAGATLRREPIRDVLRPAGLEASLKPQTDAALTPPPTRTRVAAVAPLPAMHLPVAPGPSPESAAPTPSAPMFRSETTEGKVEPQRSVENRIGSQVFNRIGIVAILIGVSLFLKLVYDKHWIHFHPASRVAMLLLAGAGVVLWSERFRRKGYAAFSYSLKAVGTGTLYLALWASFQMYHLLPAWAALLLMIGVTVWNAVMAWAQDSELLAAYALVGGFATPALLGTGGNHEVFLFSYVLAMGAAVLLLVMQKPWQRLLLGSFPGTVIYFIGWYVRFFTADQAGVTGIFAVLLAAPFMAVALVGKERDDSTEGLLAPLAAATFLALALYSVLQDSGRHGWLPWGAVALAAVYLALMRLRRGGLAEAVHLAIAVVFLTIAIPLKAEGRWITIGWLAEGVALLWVATRMLRPEVQPQVRALMRWLACGAMALGVGESLVFWAQQGATSAFWNGRFATEMCAVAALALAGWLARGLIAQKNEATISAPAWPLIRLLSTGGTHLIAALAVSRELATFWANGPAEQAGYSNQLSALSVAAFLMVYAACLVTWVTIRRAEDEQADVERAMSVIAGVYVVLGFVTMMIAPTVGDGSAPRVLWNARLMFQLVGVAALGWSAWMTWRARGREGKDAKVWIQTAGCCLVGFNLLAVLIGVREILTYFGVRATGEAGLVQGFTISAWLMVYGGALLAVGFWKRMAFVRWQGLGLLVFTIGKVFLYDVRDLSSVYRMLSFIGLGAVLMAVSFAYQKDWLQLRDEAADGAVGDEARP